MLAAALLGGVSAIALTIGEAQAACSPAATGAPAITPPPGTTVTCGTTLNQNAPNGYGTASGVPPNANNINDLSGLILNVLPGASVTGTNSGIVLAAGNTVNVGAGASVIGGFIALNLRANFGESNTVINGGTLNGGTGAGVAALGGQIIEGGDLNLTNTATIIGGTGGTGILASGVLLSSGTVDNSGSIISNGTANSAGIFVVDGQGDAAVINTNTITGLTGIAFNNFGFNASVLNAGTITGTGGTAIAFIDVGVLTLHPGSVINGNVVSGLAGNLLQLGGTGNATFDVTNLSNGATGQYQNFVFFEKIGSSTWTLTGGTTEATPWTIFGGVLEASHAVAGIVDSLGDPSTSPVTLAGGTLRITVPGAVTLANDVTFDTGATSTLSAKAGSTVTAAGNVFLNANAVATFGAATDTGTIIFDPSSTSVDGTASVVVGGGTLGAASNELGNVLSATQSTTVNAGATLAFNDFFASIHNLSGAGAVSIGSLSSSTLFLTVDPSTATEFSGVISGAGGINVSGGGTQILSGLNTYTGGTFNCACSTLQLGTLTRVGAIVGDVTNEGIFNIVNADTTGIASITNKLGGETHFFNATSASAATIVNNNGFTGFHDMSTAGTADITNRNGGETDFLNTATADHATITNRDFSATAFFDTSTAAFAAITNNGGATGFFDQSTAGNADITNRNGGATVFGMTGGADTATAGNATITNRVTGGETFFQAMTTAGAATIDNNGGATFFLEMSNAGTATITNRNAGMTLFADNATAAGAMIENLDGCFCNPSLTVFMGASDAGTATITNGNFGAVQFVDGANAANATIVNNADGVAVFGTPGFTDAPTAGHAAITNNAGGATFFQAFSTAGDAIITSNNGGAVGFFDNATGGNAQFITNAGGIVDFSQTAGPAGDGKITAGSIAGAGDYYLGGNQLTVGGNNLSTEVSGTINDGPSPFACGCGPPGTGASLVKVGTGTLILSGVNTYTGPTIVDGGMLAIAATGSITSDVTNNALFLNAGRPDRQPDQHRHGGQHRHDHRNGDNQWRLRRQRRDDRRHRHGERRRHARRQRHGRRRHHQCRRHALAGPLDRHHHGQRQPHLRRRRQLSRRGLSRGGRPRQRHRHGGARRHAARLRDRHRLTRSARPIRCSTQRAA